MTPSNPSALPAGRRRKAAGKRWSATSTVQWLDPTGATIARTPRPVPPAGAVKARVHYRLDGRSKKPVFAGTDLADQVAAFQALLVAAYANDWGADTEGRPTPPAPLPATGHVTRSLPQAGESAPRGHEAGPAALVPEHTEPADTSAARSALLPGTGPVDDASDVVKLARWYVDHVKGTHKRRGGKRSPKTTRNYEDALEFFTELARYQPGDPRLEALGLQPGAPMRCDDPATGINERDLILALEVRAGTNLRDRCVNERAMARWASACAKEESLAHKQGRAPVMPAPPALRTETAGERSIEAFARVVKAMFDAAHKRGKIPYLPWTATVDDEVKHAPSIHYTAKSLPDRDQVRRVAGEMSALWRRSTTTDGHPVSINGDRFHALVWLAGTEAPRPEESIAIRNSWVILDDGDPRLELHHAEVYHEARGGGRVRTQVPLKHREPGDIRVIRPEPEDVEEFCRVLSAHRQRYVASPNPDSPDPDARDPYFFTTHRGRPLDLSNWSDDWWKKAAARAFSHQAEAAFAAMPFRRLRATAITGWLVRGCTTEEAATKAGNSQAVLEKHYKGVLASRPRSRRAPASAAEALEIVAGALDGLDEAQLGALIASARAALRQRLDA